jgi:O-antigen/teichoic acid export membrane protein
VILLLFAPLLQSTFNISSSILFPIMALNILTLVPSVFGAAYLQGHQQFLALSAFNLVTSVAKIALPVLFVMVFGLGTSGVLLGLALAVALGVYTIRFYSKDRPPHIREVLFSPLGEDRTVLRKYLPYVIGVIITVLVSGFLFSADMLLAKYFLDPYQAGIYNGIASIAKVPYYLALIFVWMMLPQITLVRSDAYNRQWFLRYLGLAAGVGIVATFFLVILSRYIIDLSLGDEYGVYHTLMVPTAIAQLVVGVLSLYIYYLLMLKRKDTALLLVILAVLLIAFIGSMHEDSYDIARAFSLSLVLGSLTYAVIRLITPHAKLVSHESKS